MSYSSPDPGKGEGQGRRPLAGVRRRPKALIPTLVALVVLIILFNVVTDFTTDLLWYRAVDYTDVFATELTTRLVLFVIFGVLMAGVVAANVVVAYRLRPPFRGMSAEQQNLDRYRVGIDPYKTYIVVAVTALLGLIAGASASGEWRTWLQWRNSTSFGVEDPQFGLDVSFYAFSYPWWRFLLGFGFAVVLVSLLAAVLTHYLYGGLRLQTPGQKATGAAQAHLSVLIGLFVLLKAVAYWLDRYGLALAGSDLADGWTGLTYSDVNALLPAKTILTAIAVICALLFFANVVRKTWILPGIGFGLLVLSAVLIGGVYPAIVQQFQVKPSELAREQPFIERNIGATRAAYGISDVEPDPYNARTSVERGQLRSDADTTASIRLLDPTIVDQTYEQLQQIRAFYDFPSTLRVDRYEIDPAQQGKQDVLAAVREISLDGVPPGQRNWINDHLFYTHGFGFVAARGNQVTDDGEPSFVSSQIPPQGEIDDYQPRIYYGEESPEYSLVGAPEGTAPREFDFPDDNQPNGQAVNTYQGQGGVGVGSFWSKALYAVKFREPKFLLSSELNPESKVLYIRDPRERIERVAPWLTLDGDPYPAVVDGRIEWIVDGYTTTADYPYSARTVLGEATETALTTAQRRVIAQRDTVNYIRNSVKATVDAYDGTVSLYAWDESDPVLRTWMKAFPDTVKPKSEIPDALMGHLRYPEDMFKVQREILARYHVNDPRAFYGGQDFWRVPDDPTGGDVGGLSAAEEAQPPYYLTLRMPSQQKASFSLTSTFVPINRPQLAAFMAVNSEPGEDYGTIRVLQLPRNSTVPGPGQAQNNIKAEPEIAQTNTLLSRGNQVRFGNLLTLPVGGGLLYVEPLYVQAATGTSYPLLQRVIVAFGQEIAIGGSLQGALDEIFGGQAGVDTGDTTGADGGSASGNAGTGGTPSLDLSPEVADALTDARKAFRDGQAALKRGDFGAYGEAQDRLEEALTRAQNAEQGTPTPTPSPGASPGPNGSGQQPDAGGPGGGDNGDNADQGGDQGGGSDGDGPAQATNARVGRAPPDAAGT